MSTAAPRLKIDEIKNEIFALLLAGGEADFRVRQLKVQLQKQLDMNAIGPEAYHSFSAMLFWIMGNLDDADVSARAALLLNPSDSEYLRIGSMYGALMEIDKAIAVLKKVLMKYPFDKHVLTSAKQLLHGMLQFSAVEDIAKRLELINVNEEKIEDASRFQYFQRALERANSSGYTDEGFANRLKVAAKALRDFGTPCIRTSFIPLEDGSFMFQAHSNTSSRVCASATFAVADALVENFEDTWADLLSVVVKPMSEFSHIALQGTNEYKS